MIDFNSNDVSVSRQCELLGMNRSSLYYEPCSDNSFNDRLMRMIDEQYIRCPFYGVGQMYYHLNRELAKEDICINIKRVRRLMRLMGIEAICPKPYTSQGNKQNPVYPYLLKGLDIVRPNQVWCSDITFIPMLHGWVYLVAVMDCYSRYVLSWEISNTLDSSFCVTALERALASSGVHPDIFNTDQGSQFTSQAFTGVLKSHDIMISMDGRGRAFDNIFIERIWRSAKYEEVYINDYEVVQDAVMGLGIYFSFYNYDRPHQTFNGVTPAERHGLSSSAWSIKQAA